MISSPKVRRTESGGPAFLQRVQQHVGGREQRTERRDAGVEDPNERAEPVLDGRGDGPMYGALRRIPSMGFSPAQMKCTQVR